MDYNLGILIQSRMGSCRFPGKSISKIDNKSILEFILDSLLIHYPTNQIYVLTSIEEGNEKIVEIANSKNIRAMRGDEHNVASRFKTIIEKEKYSHFFRICGDTPFFLPNLVKRADNLGKANQSLDLISSKPSKSHPQGQNIEFFNSSTFLRDYHNFSDEGHFEHVTSYFYQNLNRYNYLALSSGISNFSYDVANFSVDTPDNLVTMTNLYHAMNKPYYQYSLPELYELYQKIKE